MDKKEVEVTVSAVDEQSTSDLNNFDDALLLVLENGEVEYDAVRDRKLLWKIDLFLMPLMCLLYCCQFMDKLSNSYASILGLRTDLGMKGNMYSWTGSAFYLGYLFFEFPAVRLLQRFPISRTVGAFVILWGAVLALHATPNYAGFVALRTILGMLESSITPAFVIITGQYYRKEEVFLRTAIWFASNGLGVIFGSGIAYGLSQHNASWKYVFVITGLITVFLGVLILVHLPENPSKAWFLSKEEKMLVVARIRVNQQGFGNKNFKWGQFKEAFTDVNTYLFILFAIASNIPNGGTTNFGSILLKERLGYSTQDSLLYQMPSGAVEFVGCIFFAYIAKIFDSRLPMAMFATAVTVMATALLAFCESSRGQYAGMILLYLAPLGMICILSCISSNVAGHTKKITVNALYLIAYCVGNLIGPQTFLDKEAPKYQTATICMVAFNSLALVALFGLYLSYKYENYRRDKNPSDEKMDNIEFSDLTDTENPYFRYCT